MPTAFRASVHRIDTRRQYQLLILLTVTCMVGLVLLVSLLFANIILRRNEEYVQRVIDQYRQNLSQQSAKTKEFIEAIAFNPTVIAFLAETDPFERYEYGLQVSAFLDSIQAGRNEVLDLFFLSPKGEGVTFYALSKAQPQIAKALLARSTPDIIGAYPYLSTAYGTDGSGTPALFAGCAVYDTAHSAAQKVCVGAVGVALDIAAWTGNLSKLMELKGMSYLLLDAQGNPLSGALLCDDSSLLSQAQARAASGQDGALSGGGYDMTVTLLRDIPATLLTSVDNRVLLSDLWQATLVVIAVSCGLGLLLLFAYRWINHEVALPIAALTRFIGSIGQPGALRRIRPTGNRDLRQLGETVNGMLEQQECLTQDLIRTNTNLIASELAARRAELKYLRSQINPHFLYNTLEVVRSIAVVRQVPEIVMAAKSLARILRFSIQGEDVVPLRTELSVIEDYIQIQTLRFRDRIAVQIDVSEEAQEVLVPRLCLQPAVENAFVHGLESTLSAGELRISGEVAGDLLRLVIWDNGAGISVERLEALNRLLAAPEAGAAFENNGQEGRIYETSGIGLANVALRARLLGDERHGVSVVSKPGNGTTVEIRLPARRNGERAS